MRKLGMVAVAIAAAMATGCSSTMNSLNNASTDKQKSIELYRVFDIKTGADRHMVVEAASDGLGHNVQSANEKNPIVMGEKPEKPGRFKPANMAGSMGSQMGGMMQLAMQMNSSFANMLKTAECDGAVWTATAQKDVDNAFSMSFNLCLWEYQGGYALDVYANYTKQEGGGFLGLDGLARKAAYAISGTPEAWAEKTVLDVVREIKKRAGGDVKYLEGYPKLETTPWQDSGEVFNDQGYLAAVAP
ncbi:hypothetical protein KJY73_21435 [Bowmanella sp. Y26]|uniref:hypothetical protein n=1 Tax=Bowmanella yangjiangensis TaxID=2811230 RepID=UPI001BDDBA01|nr:hypothetical protein [Bowmanella yangjiangensis]MBT1066153.1 hypothetical protein [Bowmanella yangjiangensis]